MPGTDEAIRAAASHGYESVVLVVVMLGMFSLLGVLIKSWIVKSTEREDKILLQAVERETRLSNRVTSLEEFVRGSLLGALNESTKALLTISIASGDLVKSQAELRESLHSTRPCFWSTERQREVVDQASEQLVAHLLVMVNERLQQA